jgi:hypothetical protein
MLLRVPTNPSDPWSRSLVVQTRHRCWHVASTPGMVDDRRQRGPALEPKKLSSRWNFLGGGVGSLDEGAEAQRERSGGARVIVREIPPTTKPRGA